MVYNYKPSGVCSKNIEFEIDEEGKIHNVKFTAGCPGNLAAISKLVEGMDANEVSEILEGNLCGLRQTSCADQFSKAIKEAIQK